MITVKELIDLLEDMPGDAIILSEGCDCVELASGADLNLNDENASYYKIEGHSRTVTITRELH